MARRKVGNLMALAILSAVHSQPMHPYEMASVLRSRGKDHDMRIKWGSLYTVVGNLEKHGLIEPIGSERVGGRPERTVYRITEAGRDELDDWVRELLAMPQHERSPFVAGLSIAAALPPDDVVALLRERLGRLDAEITAQRAAIEGFRAEVTRLFLVESEYELAMREAEAGWVRALLGELTSGTFEGLAEWKEWHTEATK
ncbi:PadR family transcriptional regulator [Pseudonocardia sp. TRM90224]|uniref:PadR family transcriptional regulator n=1 Tax=Pseudonocardia sp. TRM90224 TaxID=2812678 RepID=UPI001E560D3C|nr:PadR family transcriptional regulator [Pseudonocardia sp. TRM90224]